MQTRFTATQLQDPAIARADAILKRCIHCGLCTATCPTYVIRGDERDSPRGRIYLMKEMFERNEVTPAAAYHIDRCLSCLSCVTACPSGVDYMHLVDLARVRIEARGQRSLSHSAMQWLLSKVLPYPRRFRYALLLGRFAKPMRGLFEKLGWTMPAAALELVPPRLPKLRQHRAALVDDTRPWR